MTIGSDPNFKEFSFESAIPIFSSLFFMFFFKREPTFHLFFLLFIFISKGSKDLLLSLLVVIGLLRSNICC